MQQQGGVNGPRLNPDAAEFVPGSFDQHHASLAMCPESYYGWSRNSPPPPPSWPHIVNPDRTSLIYDKFTEFSNSRPDPKDIQYIMDLYTDFRKEGILTAGVQLFLHEIFAHLSWKGKTYSSDGSGMSAAQSRSRSTKDLELVIVHFAGAIKKFALYPENLTIKCLDGKMYANRDVFAMHSGFFYQKCFFDEVKVPFCNVHQMTNVKTLLLKGRVAVLKKRLQAFLRLIELLHIRGVFPSEDCGSEEKDEGNSEFFEPSCLDLSLPFSSETCTPVSKIPGCPEQVRCSECRIIFSKEMFMSHYEEYHSMLAAKIHCCNLYFLTRYEYVCHRNTACTGSSQDTNCVNISAIRHHEQSGVSVNESAVRPYINTHSTPIDDRV